MIRLASPLIALGALVFGCAAAPAKRPAVDLSAMREAMSSGRLEESFASSSSYAHFLNARLAHHEGDHPRAVDELRLALATDDQNPFLLTTLAEEHARLGDLPKAEHVLKRVIERQAGYHPAQLLMGRVLLEGHRLTRARLHLKRAIKLAPRDPDAYLVLAQLELEADAPDEAVKVVEALAAALPGEPAGYRRLGLALAERGELTRAEPLLRKAVEKDPGDFDVWVTLAQLYESTSRPDEAEQSYGRALERDPDNREVLLAAGRLALRSSSPSRARAYFDRLLALSDDPELTVKVAFSYLANRQLTEAAEVLDSARKAGASEPRIAFYAGLVHERLHHFQQAAGAYGDVPADSELFHESRLHRASCLSLAGAHQQALALFKQGLRDRPDYLLLYPAYAAALERAGQLRDAEALLAQRLRANAAPELFEALATLYERQGRNADAITLLVGALAKKPGDETLLYTLGAAYQRQGQVEKSLEKMRAVLAVNPENAAAMNFIGYTLADQGQNLDEAERLLNRALELRPDSGAFLDSLGWLYFRRGEPAKAVDMLERAAELAPGESVIIEHLGDAYRSSSRPAQAAEAYRKALEALRGAGDAREAGSQRAVLERKLKMLSSEASGR